jgi:ferredoxin
MSMEKTLKTIGAHSLDELRAADALPSLAEMEAGPCVCIECIEEIPCNPCETSCPQKALTVGEPITNLPVIDREKCTACGLCIPACPGLAITIKSVSGAKARIRIPWEYLPLPEVGDRVEMAGRLGEVICPGIMIGVSTAARNNRTAVLTAEFPKEFVEEVITIRRNHEGL